MQEGISGGLSISFSAAERTEAIFLFLDFWCNHFNFQQLCRTNFLLSCTTDKTISGKFEVFRAHQKMHEVDI